MADSEKIHMLSIVPYISDQIEENCENCESIIPVAAIQGQTKYFPRPATFTERGQ